MTTPDLPETCGAALKEWSGVCDALRDGRQVLVLRKGGIAEQRGRFEPEFPVFWLYPTHLHEQAQGLKWPAGTNRAEAPDIVLLDLLAVVTDVHYIDREDTLADLDPWHALTEDTVRARFRYRTPGLWVLLLRAYSRHEPGRVPVAPWHQGCKSWLTLEAPLSTRGATPVLGDAEFRCRVEALNQILDLPSRR